MGDISKEVAQDLPKGGFSGDEYNHVARESELDSIRLLTSKFSIEPEYWDVKNQVKLSYGRKIIGCQYSAEDSIVVAIFQYHVEAKHLRKRVVSFAAEYGVSYDLPKDATEAAAIGFCKNVGKFAAYPYFRALAAHILTEAGVSLPPLPAIASTAHIQKKPKEPSE